jgi:hypothetical protein
VDGEIIKHKEEERLKAYTEGKIINTSIMDIESIALKVKEQFDLKAKEINNGKDVKIDSVEDALKVGYKNKDNIKKEAVDKLEVMGEAIEEFMVGYRKGKIEALKDTLEDDEFVNSLLDPFNKMKNTFETKLGVNDNNKEGNEEENKTVSNDKLNKI